MRTEVFSARVKTVRLAKGMTQQELADTLGVHVMQVSKWERGAMMPSAESLSALGDVLTVSVDYLIGRVNEAQSVTDELDLPAHEREILAILRRGDIPALLRYGAEFTERQQRGRIGGGDDATFNQRGDDAGETSNKT